MNGFLRLLAVLFGLALMLPGLCAVLAGAVLLPSVRSHEILQVAPYVILIGAVTGGLAFAGWVLIRGQR